MHIPDGFINGATSAGFGVAAAGGVTAAVKRSARVLDERQVPLAGLTAAFVFAAQMFNFPVMPGMSGHLLGGVLAGVLVGPWAGMAVVAVVLVVQALFFADGGLSAIGLNVFNVAILGAGVGYVLYRGVLSALPKRPGSVVVATGVAAGLSVPLAAAGFVAQFSLGGAAEVSLSAVLVAMLGTHALIGIGEGVLSAMVVGAVMATRPDLVHGARGRSAVAGAARASVRAVLTTGALVAVVFAIVVSQFASQNPDGLEFVARSEGFADTATPSSAPAGPLAGYGSELTGTDTVDTAIAGLVGIILTMGIGYGLFRLARRGERGTPHGASGGHLHALYRHGSSPIHRLPAQLKIVSALGFVVAVVATPREAFWAFGVYAAVLVAIAAAARLTPRFVASRLVVEVPFVLVALLLPFFAGGDSVIIGGIALSVPGLWTMWNILVKATLGLWISIVLGATTTVPELLGGLGRLRVPSVLTAIAGFMLRYIDLVLGQFGRMRRAMESRAYRPRTLADTRPIASGVGSLFVRSYERGERVHLAMASRGYAGSMPAAVTRASSRRVSWAIAAGILAVWAVAAAAWGLR